MVIAGTRRRTVGSLINNQGKTLKSQGPCAATVTAGNAFRRSKRKKPAFGQLTASVVKHAPSDVSSHSHQNTDDSRVYLARRALHSDATRWPARHDAIFTVAELYQFPCRQASAAHGRGLPPLSRHEVSKILPDSDSNKALRPTARRHADFPSAAPVGEVRRDQVRFTVWFAAG
jgi:hypothetical protein